MYERGWILARVVLFKFNRTREGRKKRERERIRLIKLLSLLSYFFPLFFPCNDVIPLFIIRTIYYLPFKGTIIYTKLIYIYVCIYVCTSKRPPRVVGALSCNKRNYPLEETAFDTVRVFLSPTAERGRGFEL